MDAREEILARLRTALAVPRRDAVMEPGDVPRGYQRADAPQETGTDRGKVLDLLVKRLEDYTAEVHRTSPAALPLAIAAALGDARTVIVPPGVEGSWTEAADIAVLRDDGTAGPRDLDGIDAVLTGCHTAIAMTGTVVLRSDDVSGRRSLTLFPDLHVIVVRAEQVVLGVPRGIERMAQDPLAPWTMVSGPSATSDIELERVEGVHGPRRLRIVLVEEDGADRTGSAPARTSTPSVPTRTEAAS